MMKKAFFLLGIFYFVLSSFLPAQVRKIDLNGYYTGRYRMQSLPGLAWRPQADEYSFYDKETKSIVLENPKKNTKQTLMDFAAFTQCVQPLLSDEIKEKQRQNMMQKAFSGYVWQDAHTLRFRVADAEADFELFILYNVEKQKTAFSWQRPKKQVIADYDRKNFEFYLYQNEDGKGFFVQDFHRSGEGVFLCPDTGANIVFGEAVHRNEWNIDEGWYFSPKSHYIAFYRMDESMVEDYPLPQMEADPVEIKWIKYPMAGRNSHSVKVGIFDVQSSFAQNKTVWHYIQTDVADGEYLTNVTFSPDEKYLYITHLNRAQDHAKLIRYDVATGKKLGTLIEERDERFVEPQTRMIFLKDGNFIWQSDRDGYNHFYLYSSDGTEIKQLTKGDFVVIEALGLDPKEEELYFVTNKPKPVDRYLYSVNLKNGKLTQHTTTSGTHEVSLSDSKKYYVDVFSDLHTPTTVSLVSTDKKTCKELKKNENPYAEFDLGRDTIFSLKGVSGDDLWCEMILPPGFDSTKKYPVLLYVYGGPHLALIRNKFMNGGLFQYHISQKGFIVFMLDNRGTPYRGAEFEKCIHRRLGVCESEDQLTGLRHLMSLPFVDSTRIAVDGWSFGGFMTLTLLTEHPTLFKVGTCGGPVVNWAWYEVMYGERYMDTPQENPEGYDKTNILPKIKNLQCPLMIMHGMQDPTVVQKNSLELLHQAVEDDVLIDYLPYTNHEHNVRGRDRVQMWHKIEKYIEEHIGE